MLLLNNTHTSKAHQTQERSRGSLGRDNVDDILKIKRVEFTAIVFEPLLFKG